MAFDDTDFEKAKFELSKKYLYQEGNKCNVKLKAVQEKPSQKDTEIYVSYTIKDFTDMEQTLMEMMKSEDVQETENTESVSFAIERLENTELLECATSITKCIDYMGMRFTLIINQDQPLLMDIIAPAKKQLENTGKFTRITTESSLTPHKLCIILTLYALIIESKIFSSTTLQASICLSITNIEESENSFQTHLSHLEMDTMSERVSNSELYKQAGNSIVVAVLEAIFKEML